MKRYFEKECRIVFAVGAAVGIAAVSFLKTKKAHDLAVKGVASGMMLKDKVMENVANIKEEADDICAEAKLVAQADCDSKNDEIEE